MAIQSPYKKFKRGQRLANVETDFRSGMMFTEGAVSEGYVKTLVNFDFTTDGRDALKPRAALITDEVIVPDIDATFADPNDEAEFLNEEVTIKYVKECVENGLDYRQIILGKPDYYEGEYLDKGKIWTITSKKNADDFQNVKLATSVLNTDHSECSFYNTALTKIHDWKLVEDAKTSFPVGAFLGNSFYFFNDSNQGELQKTVFDPVKEQYIFEAVTLRDLTASEAVNYGYNMLSSSPYVFTDGSTASSFQMNGVLPYTGPFEPGEPDPDLMMTPKSRRRVWFRCNYDVAFAAGDKYKIVWSWKEVSGTDDWASFKELTDFTGGVLQADLIVPTEEILVRCEAYKTAGVGSDADAVVTAMTIGFDFSLDKDDTAYNTEQEEYDLSTATGMISWKNRLVLWGVPKDPTILFISDLDEPGYFPYPNNITIFDEPIIAVIELMDNLMVVTKSKIHQVSLNTDGVSWTSTVIQSNLYIEPWDKHLIQAVRNMLYFKSGNYYYMIVPKAQSTTGELTLAPITTPITDFFNHFKFNVQSIFKDCYKYLDVNNELVQPYVEKLVTYYNFIDYEDVHNFYVYKYKNVYVNFDISYNVVSRCWKINIYESQHFLFPFKTDATQQGYLAGTSVMNVIDTDNSIESNKRFIQLFKHDPLSVQDLYILIGTDFLYSTQYEDTTVEDEVLYPAADQCTYDSENEVLVVPKSFIHINKIPEEIFSITSLDDFVGGFNRILVNQSLEDVKTELELMTTFSNKQMLDTGYRDSNLFINKRYRELQLQINNIDNEDMEFGMDFQIAGEPRNTDFLYEVSQTIDEMKQDEGIVYIDATPYLPIPYVDDGERKGEIDKTNLWTLKHSLDPDISLWKVRASVSGKGMAPRLRLFTKNMFNYQLLGINWIYREMNMR